jgi:hypothetical protein
MLPYVVLAELFCFQQLGKSGCLPQFFCRLLDHVHHFFTAHFLSPMHQATRDGFLSAGSILPERCAWE